MRLIVKHNSETHFMTIPTLLGCGIVIAVLCNFATIKMVGKMDPALILVMMAVSVISQMITCLAVPIGGDVYEKSREILRALTRRCKGKYLQKLLKAEKPAQVQIGGYFGLKKSTKSTFCRFCRLYSIL